MQSGCSTISLPQGEDSFSRFHSRDITGTLQQKKQGIMPTRALLAALILAGTTTIVQAQEIAGRS